MSAQYPKLKIESDGMTQTKLIEVETGMDIAQFTRRITWELEAHGLAKISVEFVPATAEMVGYLGVESVMKLMEWADSMREIMKTGIDSQ